MYRKQNLICCFVCALWFLASIGTAAAVSRNQEVIFVIDCSYSMNDSDSRRNVINAVREVALALPKETAVGLVTFDTEVRKVILPHQTRDALLAGLTLVDYQGYTNTGVALQKAANSFSSQVGNKKTIILISDGEISMSEQVATDLSKQQYEASIQICKKEGLEVYTLLLGDRAVLSGYYLLDFSEYNKITSLGSMDNLTQKIWDILVNKMNPYSLSDNIHGRLGEQSSKSTTSKEPGGSGLIHWLVVIVPLAAAGMVLLYWRFARLSRGEVVAVGNGAKGGYGFCGKMLIECQDASGKVLFEPRVYQLHRIIESRLSVSLQEILRQCDIGTIFADDDKVYFYIDSNQRMKLINKGGGSVLLNRRIVELDSVHELAFDDVVTIIAAKGGSRLRLYYKNTKPSDKF